MTKNLTAAFVDTLKATGHRAEYHDSVTRGLTLRVTPSGEKSWTVMYYAPGGRRRRYTIGPVSPALSLKIARDQANKILAAAKLGKDPAEEKQTARAGETVGDLATAYITEYAKVQKKSWAEDERMLNVEVLPTLKHRTLASLTRQDVRKLVTEIAKRGSPYTANRCLALVRKMLNFAIASDYPGLNGNPASLIPKPGKETSRERVLTPDEIRLVWAACAIERPAMCALQRLRLVTAQRAADLERLKWTDLERNWLTIPASVTKNKRPHGVPLSTLAREVLASIPRIARSPYIFPGRPETVACSDTKKAGQRIAAAVLNRLKDTDPQATFDFRGHDLRRTAATLMGANGVPRFHIARVLNHAEGGPESTQVYDRYDYQKEKQAALDVLDHELRRILKDRVAPFTRVELSTRRAKEIVVMVAGERVVLTSGMIKLAKTRMKKLQAK